MSKSNYKCPECNKKYFFHHVKIKENNGSLKHHNGDTGEVLTCDDCNNELVKIHYGYPTNYKARGDMRFEKPRFSKTAPKTD